MTTLNARPEAITFDAQQSALIVVDMQNAYASKGGYLDLAGGRLLLPSLRLPD